MATYVLVPGGWRGGWYFQDLAKALEAHGHQAHAVTLTGLGDRRHLLNASVNLDTHIQDVVQLLETENLTEVILLAHSYGGMVISGVLDSCQDRISAAIYCDAYVPEEGQSCFSLTSDAFRKLFLENAALDGFSVLPPTNTDARITAHPLASFLQKIHFKNQPPQVKRGFIYLSGWKDTPFASTYERLRKLPEWQTYDLPVGHSVTSVAFNELLDISLQFA